ncbi:hypothetical protein [Mycobacteroides salmoniphilum]|uniref:Terminase small subunit n=1 Tax=Mycobacteroides salmoniphilum TaxID=404941 RepID=A0A4R8SZV4_9MYCO|nr:hypothetical protein [Mycobacteroides salmoniphilum]TEA09155.1 hypothetical protein CCUG60884_00324 [Mycobacteroides salmoniphilum]
MSESDRLHIAMGRLNAVKPENLTDAEAVQYAQAVGLVELAGVLRGLAPVIGKAMADESAGNQLLATVAASLKEIQGTLDWDYTKRHGESPSASDRRKRVRDSSADELGSYLSGN